MLLLSVLKHINGDGATTKKLTWIKICIQQKKAELYFTKFTTHFNRKLTFSNLHRDYPRNIWSISYHTKYCTLNRMTTLYID